MWNFWKAPMLSWSQLVVPICRENNDSNNDSKMLFQHKINTITYRLPTDHPVKTVCECLWYKQLVKYNEPQAMPTRREVLFQAFATLPEHWGPGRCHRLHMTRRQWSSIGIHWYLCVTQCLSSSQLVDFLLLHWLKTESHHSSNISMLLAM